MTAPGSLSWFAFQEARLQWREFLAMMTGGKPRRAIGLVVFALVFGALMHWLAMVVLTPQVAHGIHPDKATLVLITGTALFSAAVMLSQSIESVTRAYYARADLDLLLSSPAPVRRLFAVRTAAIAAGTVLLTCVIASPAINALAIIDGPRWLAAYGVIASMGAVAAGLGILISLLLFSAFGPRRARLVAQIIAAVIGAGFVIAIQAFAILHFGSASRLTVLQSPETLAALPDAGHWLYLPARAALGDLSALPPVMLAAGAFLLAVILLSAGRFERYALAAASLARATTRSARAHAFRQRTPRQVLRAKEWLLLRRDPWLLSQTLMQVLYLVPPALLLWLNYGNASGVTVVVVPVLVMAAGQLAGGLAWLAVSGEDAHDLVVTAPVPAGTVLRAKIEAVLIAVLAIIAPLILAFALFAPLPALITAAGVAVAAGTSTAIQIWFRKQARRSMFRRRQNSSRIATLAEAFSAIFWAGTAAALAIGGMAALFAFIPALLALLVMLVAYLIRPRD